MEEKHIKVLGIMWEENSTAALVVDGRVVASVSEERFSRVKNDERYPRRAIDYVLREGKVKARELDAIAFIGTMWGPAYILTRRYSTFSMEDHVREQREYWYPTLYKRRKLDYLDIFKEKLDLEQYPGPSVWKKVIAFTRKNRGTGRSHDKRSEEFFQAFRRDVVGRHLGIDPGKIRFIDHSTGHAMYAYFAGATSGDALVLTADAWGDNVNASVNLARGGRLERISSSSNFIIAHLYRYMTLALGMKPNEHEYKVMGLAPYAKEKYRDQVAGIFARVQRVSGLGFEFDEEPKDRYFYFKEKLEGHRFDAIAGGLQQYTEQVLLAWVCNGLEMAQSDVVCFAGGVAMNVKANMLIQALPAVKALHVNPTPDDASQAIGASFALVHEECIRSGINPRQHMKPLTNAYLGPALDIENLPNLLRAKRASSRYRVRRVSPRDIAKLLAKGKVIGRAAGRSEFGARALGNRSILADPRDPGIISTINEKIKNRDFWMPFAASILERRASDYLVGFKAGAPWMTIAFETTPLAHRDLRAGMHPADGTCRPQVIPKGQNPGYETIIEAFEKETGVGGLLNTSFNLHGEPIVQSVADAWRVFELSGLDALLLEDTLIEKEP